MDEVTHLDQGKALYSVISEAIEKLRPDTEIPGDPPPREWYPYLILHGAYMEDKLNRTIENCLQLAEEKGLKEVVFPPMGTGFYGVPLEMSAMVSLSAFKNYLSNGGSIENLKICLVDNREYNAFEDAFSALLK